MSGFADAPIPDPTYSQDEIRARLEWELAFTLSEIMNDNAPIGWSGYVYAARCLLNHYDVAPKEGRTPPA